MGELGITLAIIALTTMLFATNLELKRIAMALESLAKTGSSSK
jgi:hypothetical protein